MLDCLVLFWKLLTLLDLCWRWVFKVRDIWILSMDGRVGVTDGERVSMFLWGLTGVTFQLHPVPQPASVRTSKLSSCAQIRHTHTGAHCGTHSRLGLELEKRFPERFLKVELLKAWMAASALKLHEPLLSYAYHQAEWRQCFNWSTKRRL